MLLTEGQSSSTMSMLHTQLELSFHFPFNILFHTCQPLHSTTSVFFQALSSLYLSNYVICLFSGSHQILFANQCIAEVLPWFFPVYLWLHWFLKSYNIKVKMLIDYLDKCSNYFTLSQSTIASWALLLVF